MITRNSHSIGEYRSGHVIQELCFFDCVNRFPRLDMEEDVCGSPSVTATEDLDEYSSQTPKLFEAE